MLMWLQLFVMGDARGNWLGPRKEKQKEESSTQCHYMILFTHDHATSGPGAVWYLQLPHLDHWMQPEYLNAIYQPECHRKRLGWHHGARREGWQL